MKLKEIKTGQSLAGIEPTQIVTVVTTVPLGDAALQLIYRTPDGGIKERLLGGADEPSISIATIERPFSFDGDGAAFQLACEAKRIDFAFLFDPMMAVHSSNVEPLPHQITAVYESMLPRQPRLNIDLLQKKQAEKELQAAEEVLPRAVRECYRWLVCPVQETPTDPKPTVEAFAVNTTGSSFGREIERVCVENELVITTWSPIHLRTKLLELYWKEDRPAAGAIAFWEDTLRYLYLPRLKDRDVLAQAIHSGAASRDFFGTAYGQKDGGFEGFHLGSNNLQVDDTLLLIEPEASSRGQP